MNNKMVINPYPPTTESKKQINMQNRNKLLNIENILRPARWEGDWVDG